jgi:uncharacterized membrane protein YcaP (DUF421 family)
MDQAWSQLFGIDAFGLLIIVVRTVVVYFALLFGLRFAGKRELGQLTPFDLVLLLVIANAVQTAMVGADTTLIGGLVAAFTLLGVNWLVGQLGFRSRLFRAQFIGTPTVLAQDGHLVAENMRREGVFEDEIMEALREHGIEDLSSVKLAVLEVDGTISVVPGDAHVTRTRRRVRTHKRSN